MGTPEADQYRHYEPPDSPHNRRVAQAQRWSFDPAYGVYRDRHGFAMLGEAQPQPNAVDCWK